MILFYECIFDANDVIASDIINNNDGGFMNRNIRIYLKNGSTIETEKMNYSDAIQRQKELFELIKNKG